jgi:putative membrane protein
MPYRIALLIVVVTHLVGAVGLRTPFAGWFILLTPVHLLVSFTLLYSQSSKSDWLKVGLLFVYLIGLGIEMVGVNTGFPFGNYVYLEGLGPQIAGTPWLIGLNWSLLALATASFASDFLADGTRLQRALLASGLMLGLDVLMEPVAQAHRLWMFAGGVAPWENYVSWFVVAFATQWILGSRTAPNRIAVPVLIAQAAFFALSWLWPLAI